MVGDRVEPHVVLRILADERLAAGSHPAGSHPADATIASDTPFAARCTSDLEVSEAGR